jgi:hypothetical protein
VHGADRGGLVVHCSSRCRIEFDTVISQFDAGKPRFTPPTPQAASCKPLPREPNEGAGIVAALPLHATSLSGSEYPFGFEPDTGEHAWAQPLLELPKYSDR